jgi:hypothetical protein
MTLSLLIINQLSKAGLFLPNEVLTEAPKPKVHTPQSTQAASQQAARRTQSTGPQDPFAAAAARRERMQSNLDSTASSGTDGDGRPGFRSGKKVSREQAAEEKAAIRASLRAQAENAYEPITRNSTPPSIRDDLSEHGIDLGHIESQIDPD